MVEDCRGGGIEEEAIKEGDEELVHLNLEMVDLEW